MDGDVAPLEAICDLAERFNAMPCRKFNFVDER
jgi:7-keto-8-aminopelargonate synthetase-like enzyme